MSDSLSLNLLSDVHERSNRDPSGVFLGTRPCSTDSLSWEMAYGRYKGQIRVRKYSADFPGTAKGSISSQVD